LCVIASEAKQSRFHAINEMQIASVVFDSLAMTIMGLTQSSHLQKTKKQRSEAVSVISHNAP
jgi:hypothetical protein